MKITIKRKGKGAVMRITAETKRDQRILAEGIRRGLGIRTDKKGDGENGRG